MAIESPPAATWPSTLTMREREVAEMLVRGHTNREIAEHLEISIKTVDTHRGHALKKLGRRNTVALTRWAVRVGLISVDQDTDAPGSDHHGGGAS